MKEAEKDILIRATYPLLGIQAHSRKEILYFRYFTFSIARPMNEKRTRYQYEAALDARERSRTRVLLMHNQQTGSQWMLAMFKSKQHMIEIFESQKMMRDEPDVRVITNFIERQVYELVPGVKVERSTGENLPMIENMNRGEQDANW